MTVAAHIARKYIHRMDASRGSCPKKELRSPMDHLSEERLADMAGEPELMPSEEENAHLENCSQCLNRFIELVRDSLKN